MQGNPGASPELSRNGKHHCQSFGLSDALITNLFSDDKSECLPVVQFHIRC